MNKNNYINDNINGNWVFLRGLIRQQKHWEDFPQLFAQSFPSANVHTLDLPGNGLYYDYPSPTNVRDMMEAARTTLTRKDIDGPVNLMAISLGGMVAIEWMKCHRDQVAAAVIINSSLRNTGKFWERLQPRNYPAIIKHLILDRETLAREQLILELSSNISPNKEDLALRWSEYARTHPTSTKNALRQLLAAASYKAPQQRPHDQVLLLCSTLDRLVNPICSQRMAEKWQWPLRTHPAAGHDIPLDDGQWIIEQIRDWSASL